LAATLLVLVLPAPASALVDMPTDPSFPGNGWSSKIGWTPPENDVGYPVIAVVDTGLWAGFDDFAGYLDDESGDCAGSNGTVRRMVHPTDVDDLDPGVHGTKVATLAAAPANGKGSVGVSPNSHLIVVRVTTDNDSFALKCAFNYLAGVAAAQPLVVNVSSEFARAPDRATQVALDRLITAGALVVAAAGNTKGGPVQWPASADHVLAIGRDDGAGARGSKLDLVAPGANLLLPEANGQWKIGAQGTSFSSPIVAGAAARVWGPLPVDNPQVVTYLLRKFAKQQSKGNGFGLVNIAMAIAGAKKLPRIDESEPNDKTQTAQAKKGCTRTCTLRGLVASTDDRTDFWRLSGRGRCPKGKLKTTGGVSANCFRVTGRGGGTFVKVETTKRLGLGLYTVNVPR
jgi:hypothetical protein